MNQLNQAKVSALAITLALTACSKQDPEKPEQSKAIEIAESPLSIADLPEVSEVDTILVAESAALDKAKAVFKKWHQSDEHGKLIVSFKERKEALETLKAHLFLPDNAELVPADNSGLNGILTAGERLKGAIIFNQKYPAAQMEFSYSFLEDKGTLLKLTFEPQAFGAEYQRISDAVKPYCEQLSAKGLISAEIQRRTKDTVFLGLADYAGNRRYPALIIPAVVDLKSGKIQIPTQGQSLDDFLPRVSKALSNIDLGLGEVFKVVDEGKGSRIKMIKGWYDEEADAANGYELKLSFFLNQDDTVRVTNAMLSIKDFGHRLEEAVSIASYREARSFAVAFASDTLSALILPKEKVKAGELPFELAIMEERAPGQLRTHRFIADKKSEVSEDSEALVYESGDYRVVYYPGHGAFSINGRFAVKALIADKIGKDVERDK